MPTQVIELLRAQLTLTEQHIHETEERIGALYSAGEQPPGDLGSTETLQASLVRILTALLAHRDALSAELTRALRISN